MSAFVQIYYRPTTLHTMSGIFLALLCAQCLAGLFLGAELWNFHRHVSKSSTHSRRSSVIERPQISSKKRHLKVSLLIPDDYQMPSALRELELLHRDAKLRILQLENDQELHNDE